MPEKSKPADTEPKVSQLEPGEPVEAVALSQMGSTFAERAAAREKAVSGESAENKSVSSSQSSRKRKK